MATETTGAERTGAGGMVTVKYSAYNATLPVAGKTVKQVMDELTSEWGIEAGAKGYYGKTELADDTVVEAGKVLTIHRVLGEKGTRR